MKKVIVILFLLLSFNGQTQRFFENDTTINIRRTVLTSGTIFTGYTGSMLALKNIWYKDKWGNFSFFDDSKEWLGMDKFGHAYTGNLITKNISGAYRWAGVKRKKSLWISSAVAFTYLATLELQDGFAKQWGFSWSDIGANSLGIAWYIWQELLWNEQRLKLKFSAHLSPYAQYRPNVLGSNFSERILKDYNGQTYWITISPKQFILKNTSFPKWLGLSLGYSVDGKLHGNDNYYTTVGNNENTLHFNAKSQFLFSLDIDFEQFNPKRKWIEVVFKAINHLKIPFPTIILNGNKFTFNPIYF